MTHQATQLLDSPVIATESGKQLGLIDELIFEPGQYGLFGFVLKANSDNRKMLLPRAKVKAVGKDAVTFGQHSFD